MFFYPINGWDGAHPLHLKEESMGACQWKYKTSSSRTGGLARKLHYTQVQQGKALVKDRGNSALAFPKCIISISPNLRTFQGRIFIGCFPCEEEYDCVMVSL